MMPEPADREIMIEWMDIHQEDNDTPRGFWSATANIHAILLFFSLAESYAGDFFSSSGMI